MDNQKEASMTRTPKGDATARLLLTIALMQPSEVTKERIFCHPVFCELHGVEALDETQELNASRLISRLQGGGILDQALHLKPEHQKLSLNQFCTINVTPDLAKLREAETKEFSVQLFESTESFIRNYWNRSGTIPLILQSLYMNADSHAIMIVWGLDSAVIDNFVELLCLGTDAQSVTTQLLDQSRSSF